MIFEASAAPVDVDSFQACGDIDDPPIACGWME